MNICLVSYEYPPETFNGIGSYTRNLAEALAALGEHVDVVTFTSKKPYDYTENGVHVHRVNPIAMAGLWRFDALIPSKTIGFSIAVKNKIMEISREKNLDIIEGPDIRAELFWYLLTRGGRGKPPVVIKLHTPSYVVQRYNFKSLKLHERVLNFMEKYAIMRADYLTSPSQSMAEVVAADYRFSPRRVKILLNPLDTDTFRPAEAPGPRERVPVLFTGRIEKRKGVVTLAHAIPLVLEKFRDCEFIFVGEDTASGQDRTSLREELKAYLRQKNCLGHVTFHDRKEKNDLVRFYQSCDIFTAPSLYENLGYVCLEAMGCGKAVVVSATGGLKEIVDHEHNGLLVAPDQPQALADEIVRLCQNKGLRDTLGKEAKKFIDTHYTNKVAAQKTIDFYGSILRNNTNG
ncbi:MAG: glycosyltransferase family 4 protein [Candidatus Omnitrophica bacterium]|nr:glycosyltransferase family 4 protein [Candidatus Omnitrophota bacterium]